MSEHLLLHYDLALRENTVNVTDEESKTYIGNGHRHRYHLWVTNDLSSVTGKSPLQIAQNCNGYSRNTITTVRKSIVQQSKF